MKLQTGDRITVTIEKLVHGGHGLARPDGRVVFVPEVLPDEVAQIQIREVKKDVAFGRLLQVLEPSPHRISPPCKIYSECGGCQIQHIASPRQPEIKKALVLDAFHRIGRMSEVNLQTMISSPSPYGYRTRTQLKARYVNQRARLGFYSEGTHRHVPVDECLVIHPELNKILKPLEQIMSEDRFKSLQPTSVHLNLSSASREILVRLLLDARLASNELKETGEDLYNRLKGTIGSIAGLVLSPRRGARLTFGNDFIEERLGEFRYRISDGSFSQISPETAGLLVEQVVRLAELAGSERVLELHCGIGTISLPVAARSAHLRGIDANRVAIEDARFNAEANRIKNTEFICADAEQGLRQSLAEGRTYDRLVLDPPRAGLTKTEIDLIARLAPTKIIYVSCEMSTLARDLHRLGEQKYIMGRLQPVDMFPQTAHVELAAEVLLRRNDS
jgi:23S rRNA (uracil1939-C5)-methyltransferase